MLRQFSKRINVNAIRARDFAQLILFRASSSDIDKDKFEVKINQTNETFELYEKKVNIASGKLKKFEFPFVYLRDNCQCEFCYHAQSSSRTLSWENFDVSIKPKNFLFDDSRNVLKVIWNDNEQHTSEYDYEWLKARNFSIENREHYLKTFYRPDKKLWTKNNFKSILQNFDFMKIIETDHELYDWLNCLAIHGVAIIKNTPQTENEIRRIAERVGFIRRTHYGEDFTVKAKEGASNVAYLTAPLQMHADLPYYHHAPGVNILHCLVQSKSKGAENLLTDGFQIVNIMKQDHPEEFEALSKILVNWYDVGKEESGPPFHSILRAPMFCFDYENKIERINHSIPQRDSFFTASVEDVKRWYKALAKFIELIHREAVEFKTEEGTILSFDNSRLLHGRKQYEDSAGNYRHLVGAYLDWDEIYSRLRVLQKELKKKY
ncbi:CLUMA_CG011299, isoform A [Clunio marinus]|uniref:CLUMA_CG011299, isoform A n=1 Tax=Clunio marinus TaxID=568069 RepID=A0A1J1IFW2_9DIPT|nr:CLUMA_CG011299, isoform A [Clunio marinus]